MPAEVPSSRSDEVPSVVAESQRVAKPRTPPATPFVAKPSVEVDTHFVDVPVA